MREIRPSGSEGGVALTTSSLPLSYQSARRDGSPYLLQLALPRTPYISHFAIGQGIAIL
jgi:hypothetical protein